MLCQCFHIDLFFLFFFFFFPCVKRFAPHEKVFMCCEMQHETTGSLLPKEPDLCYPKNLPCLHREGAAFKTGIWTWYQKPRSLGESSLHLILPVVRWEVFPLCAVQHWRGAKSMGQIHLCGSVLGTQTALLCLWFVCGVAGMRAGCCCIPTKGSVTGQALSQPTQTCCTWLITFIMVIFSPSQEQGTVQNQPPFVSPGTTNLFPQATPPF